MKTNTNMSRNLWSTLFIKHIKVAGELVNPNGTTTNSQWPYLVLEVVLLMSSSLIRTWWYPYLLSAQHTLKVLWPLPFGYHLVFYLWLFSPWFESDNLLILYVSCSSFSWAYKEPYWETPWLLKELPTWNFPLEKFIIGERLRRP